MKHVDRGVLQTRFVTATDALRKLKHNNKTVCPEGRPLLLFINYDMIKLMSSSGLPIPMVMFGEKNGHYHIRITKRGNVGDVLESITRLEGLLKNVYPVLS